MSLFQTESRLHDHGLLILRVAFGLCIMFGHGLGKVTRLFSGGEIEFADPFGFGPAVSLGLAAFAEVICASLLILGLLTRAALIPLLVVVATALFAVHIDQPFGQQERPLLFACAFIALLLTGPGRFSLDALIWKR